MKNILSVSKESFSGKTVLVRVDLNVSFEDKAETRRLLSALPTIEHCLARGAKVVILSHFGRPTPRTREESSLKPFGKIFAEKLRTDVRFFPHFDFPRIRWEVATRPERVFLLENLRFEKGEEKNDPAFSRSLASLGDIYVNEAFSVSHRAHASVSGITKYIPAYAGISLVNEIEALGRGMKKIKKPFVVIAGGAKAADKLELLSALAKRADAFLLGGAPANTLLKAEGFPVGKSLYDKGSVGFFKKFPFPEKIIFPADWVVSEGRILDIGQETRKTFGRIISSARTILWSGPVGFYHKEKWSSGTRAIWKAILTNKKASAVIGGGETASSVRLVGKTPESLMRQRKSIFFSTGGGAMIEFLSGKKLPGIVALEKSKKKTSR